MIKIKLINCTNGVLVLPDMYNANHVNLMPQAFKEFTEMEYGFYRKMAEVRIRNGLLKLERVEYPEEVKKEITPEVALAEVVDDKPEFDDAGYEEAELQLAGLDEEIKKEEPKISKKKKSKNKKS